MREFYLLFGRGKNARRGIVVIVSSSLTSVVVKPFSLSFFLSSFYTRLIIFVFFFVAFYGFNSHLYFIIRVWIVTIFHYLFHAFITTVSRVRIFANNNRFMYLEILESIRNPTSIANLLLLSLVGSNYFIVFICRSGRAVYSFIHLITLRVVSRLLFYSMY